MKPRPPRIRTRSPGGLSSGSTGIAGSLTWRGDFMRSVVAPAGPSSGHRAAGGGHRVVPVLPLVVAEVLPGADGGHPLRVGQIPADGLPQALREGHRRPPAQLALD